MFSFPTSGKAVLFATLNWGLGHSSRSIPIIHSLLEQGKKVTIASDGEALKLLQMEFPQLPAITLPQYRVRYKKTLFQIIVYNLVNICFAIFSEHRFLKKHLQTNNYDLIISDSRFGFFNSKVYSIIISHQLNIQSSNLLLKMAINRINRFFINRFNECWVPDCENHLLSGALSQNDRINNVKYIGLLSRMNPLSKAIKYDTCIVLSGPEPSRTILEKTLLKVLSFSSLKIVLVRGTDSGQEISFPHHWEVYSLINSKRLNELLLSSAIVISRSGYSSIMDYVKLGLSAILIPTPGQSEQEYLGEYLDGKYGFKCVNESEIQALKNEVDNLDNLETLHLRAED